MAETILEEVRRLADLAREMQAQTTQAVSLVRSFMAVVKLLTSANEMVMAENAKLIAEVARLQAMVRSARGARA